MCHTAMFILEMKYSTINPRLEILDGRIKCFETAEEAIAHAKKNKCRAYELGTVIYGQLEFNFKRRNDEIHHIQTGDGARLCRGSEADDATGYQVVKVDSELRSLSQ